MARGLEGGGDTVGQWLRSNGDGVNIVCYNGI